MSTTRRSTPIEVIPTETNQRDHDPEFEYLMLNNMELYKTAHGIAILPCAFALQNLHPGWGISPWYMFRAEAYHKTSNLSTWDTLLNNFKAGDLASIGSLCVVWHWFIDFNVIINFYPDGSSALKVEVSELNDITPSAVKVTNSGFCDPVSELVEKRLVKHPPVRDIEWFKGFSEYLEGLDPMLVPVDEDGQVIADDEEDPEDGKVPWEM